MQQGIDCVSYKSFTQVVIVYGVIGLNNHINLLSVGVIQRWVRYGTVVVGEADNHILLGLETVKGKAFIAVRDVDRIIRLESFGCDLRKAEVEFIVPSHCPYIILFSLFYAVAGYIVILVELGRRGQIFIQKIDAGAGIVIKYDLGILIRFKAVVFILLRSARYCYHIIDTYGFGNILFYAQLAASRIQIGIMAKYQIVFAGLNMGIYTRFIFCRLGIAVNLIELGEMIKIIGRNRNVRSSDPDKHIFIRGIGVSIEKV